MPSTHKKNDGVVTDPQAKYVGPFGKANMFIDNLAAGLIWNLAVEELMRREEELRIQLETMDAEEAEMLLPTLIAEKAELEAQWTLAMAVMGEDDEQ